MIDEFDYDPDDVGIQRNYTGRTAQATGQPVTPDREAMIEVAAQAMTQAHHKLMLVGIGKVNATLPEDQWCSAPPPMEAEEWGPEAAAAVDALLPLLAEALDRARQQGKREGREEAGQAIIGAQEQGSELLPFGYAARLARGGPNRKDEE